MGRADVGLVRTSLLESMTREGRLNPSALRIVNQRHVPGFPYMLSSRLYPEWPLARVAGVPDQLAKDVLICLLALPPDHPATRAAGILGWTLPLNYQSVHDLFRTARLGPYANLVGGQDELVFDGASFALDAQKKCCMRLPSFEEALGIVDFDAGSLHSEQLAEELSIEAEAYQALVLGVRDYIGKTGFKGAIIGLSGGIDSALTLCVAVDALGADKVRAVMMPSPYTAQMSLDDSREMIRVLGVRYDEIAIAPAMAVYGEMLDPLFVGLPADTTEENIQARIRGNILMAISNKTGSLVLTTGNKSEMAVGYCTLYGDMAGGFAVIKDVYKTLVYRLSRYRNTLCQGDPVIPENIIVRPPSAELKPDQTDQDSLPPYEVLDAIVRAYMEEDRSPREIIAAGLPEDAVRRVVRLLRIAEYKRRQAPIGIRITARGFGKDWRYPITNRYPDEF